MSEPITGPIDYLSPAWLRAADEAARTMEPLPTSLAVGYAVSHDGGPREYTVWFGPDEVSIRPGLDRPTVVLRTQWPTAVAIATGATSAQRAFLDGDLTIEGDPGVLLGHGRALIDLDDRLGDLRARTRF